MLIVIKNSINDDQIKKLRKFIDLGGYKSIVFERVSTLSKTKKMISSSTDPIIIINDYKRNLSKRDIENIRLKYDENVSSNIQVMKYPEDESSFTALEDIINEYYDSIHPKFEKQESNIDTAAYIIASNAIEAAVEIEMRTANNSYDINEIWYRIRNSIISCLSDSMRNAEGGIDAKNICAAISIVKKFIDKTNEEFSK